MQKNGKQEEHVKGRIKRATIIMGQVWGIGKRRFGKDWNRRLWLFDRLIWTVLSYGVEIWDWKTREEMERLKEKYMRWILEVEGWVPGYMMIERNYKGIN